MPPAHVLDTTKLCKIRLLETPYSPRTKEWWKRQSFCQKHDTSSHYFALWTSNLSLNTILKCSRFVASFNFCDQTIDNAKIIKKTLSIFSLSNKLLHQQYHRHKYAKYFDLIHDRLQVEKYDALLTKNHQLCPTGLSTTIRK